MAELEFKLKASLLHFVDGKSSRQRIEKTGVLGGITRDVCTRGVMKLFPDPINLPTSLNARTIVQESRRYSERAYLWLHQKYLARLWNEISAVPLARWKSGFPETYRKRFIEKTCSSRREEEIHVKIAKGLWKTHWMTKLPPLLLSIFRFLRGRKKTQLTQARWKMSRQFFM